MSGVPYNPNVSGGIQPSASPTSTPIGGGRMLGGLLPGDSPGFLQNPRGIVNANDPIVKLSSPRNPGKIGGALSKLRDDVLNAVKAGNDTSVSSFAQMTVADVSPAHNVAPSYSEGGSAHVAAQYNQGGGHEMA